MGLQTAGGLRSPLGMVAGTASSTAVQLPSGRFAACWPIGLGSYNGGAAVFLASERRILDPREEVLPIPISEDAVPLLSEASETGYCCVALLYHVQVRGIFVFCQACAVLLEALDTAVLRALKRGYLMKIVRQRSGCGRCGFAVVL